MSWQKKSQQQKTYDETKRKTDYKNIYIFESL